MSTVFEGKSWTSCFEQNGQNAVCVSLSQPPVNELITLLHFLIILSEDIRKV